jgi:hypothetical protein
MHYIHLKKCNIFTQEEKILHHFLPLSGKDSVLYGARQEHSHFPSILEILQGGPPAGDSTVTELTEVPETWKEPQRFKIS